ncbi:MAG: DUF1697 domain-containing protein [Bacteroidales bacterium]|nr:DUF1697 domain-containing protein [Bacteroidales bacterium]
MKTYISILRGINVSGHKIIKMEALRTSYENMGFSNVKTYVQSGNVIFSYDDIEINKLEEQIFQQIKKDFGFDVPVIVMSIEKIEEIIKNNPFLKDKSKEESFMHVTFLASKSETYNFNAIEEKKQDNEDIVFSDYAVYLYCPNGYGNTKLNNNFIETKLKVRATTRNWKTTNELFQIAKQLN